MDRKLIITINREYGSGGKIIGKKLSEKLLLGIKNRLFKMSKDKANRIVLER